MMDVLMDWLKGDAQLKRWPGTVVGGTRAKLRGPRNFLWTNDKLHHCGRVSSSSLRRNVCKQRQTALDETNAVMAMRNLVLNNNFLNGFRTVTTLDVLKLLHLLRPVGRLTFGTSKAQTKSANP